MDPNNLVNELARSSHYLKADLLHLRISILGQSLKRHYAFHACIHCGMALI